MFRAKPLPGDLTPPVDADDDYDAELDQSPLDLAAMVTEALGRGLGNTETMLEQAAKRHGVASVGGRRGPKAGRETSAPG